MSRRSMKNCLLCQFDGGDIPATAKYYIPPDFVCDDGKKPCNKGWIPVCDHCASMVERHNPQFRIVYYNPNHKPDYGPYNHDWGPKINLVSNPDGTDTYECVKCHMRIDVLIWNRPLNGCTVPGVKEGE
jgi:hypothetical protein